MNDDQKRRLALAGTVAFPPQGQGTVELAVSGSTREKVVTATVCKPRVSVARTFSAIGVRAVMVPGKSKDKWYVGDSLRKWLSSAKSPVKGVIYVAEDTQTLLEVSTGMSAAEAVEYYPPLAAAVNVSAASAPVASSGVDGVGCPVGCPTTGSGGLPMGGC